MIKQLEWTKPYASTTCVIAEGFNNSYYEIFCNDENDYLITIDNWKEQYYLLTVDSLEKAKTAAQQHYEKQKSRHTTTLLLKGHEPHYYITSKNLAVENLEERQPTSSCPVGLASSMVTMIITYHENIVL